MVRCVAEKCRGRSSSDNWTVFAGSIVLFEVQIAEILHMLDSQRLNNCNVLLSSGFSFGKYHFQTSHVRAGFAIDFINMYFISSLLVVVFDSSALRSFGDDDFKFFSS